MATWIYFAEDPVGSGAVAAESATDALTELGIKVVVDGAFLKSIAAFATPTIYTFGAGKNLASLYIRGRGSQGVIQVGWHDEGSGNATVDVDFDTASLSDTGKYVLYAHRHVSGTDGIVTELYELDNPTPLQGGIAVDVIGGALPTTAGGGAQTLHNIAYAAAYFGVGVYSPVLGSGALRCTLPTPADDDIVKCFRFAEGTGATAADGVGGNAMTLSGAGGWGSDGPTPALKFTTQPANTNSGAGMANVVVSATTDGTTVDTSFTGNITLSLLSGDGVLSGTLTRAAVAGVATFNDLSILGYTTGARTLQAAASGYSNLPSASFTITVTATRMFVSATATPGISPAAAGGWSSAASMVRRTLATTKTNTAITTVGVAETSTTNPYNVALLQMHSPALVGSGFIAGTVHGIFRMLESNASMNAYSQLVIRVVSADGTTVRGTALDVVNTGGTEWATTTAANRYAGLTANRTLTPVAFSNGDRILIELGYCARNTSATSYTGTIRYGDPTGTELADAESGTTDNCPWIEFSQALPFTAPAGSPIAVKSMALRLGLALC